MKQMKEDATAYKKWKLQKDKEVLQLQQRVCFLVHCTSKVSDQICSFQGFSYLSEVWARGMLKFEKKHFDHQIGEKMMQSNRTRSPF